MGLFREGGSGGSPVTLQVPSHAEPEVQKSYRPTGGSWSRQVLPLSPQQAALKGISYGFLGSRETPSDQV